MDLYKLKPGDQVRTNDGATAEIVSETQDGEWVLVRYIHADDPSLVGTENLCHDDEVTELIR